MLPQDKNSEFDRLHILLQRLPQEEKSAEQWQSFERSLFNTLDQNRSTISESRIGSAYNGLSSFFSNYRRIPAIAYATVLLSLCAFLLYFYASMNFHQNTASQLSVSIVGSKGNISITTKTGTKTIKDSTNIPLHQGTTIGTGNDATAIVLINKQTHCIVSPNSVLRLSKLTNNKIIVALDKGAILSSVQKQKKNQSFVIQTPNAQATILGTILHMQVTLDSVSSTSVLTVVEGRVAMKNRSAGSNAAPVFVDAGSSVSMHQAMVVQSNANIAAITQDHSFTLLTVLRSMSTENSTEKGILDIESIPLAVSIFINDSIKGQTPFTMSLPVGSYTVKAEKPGFEPWQQRIEITSNTNAFLSLSLVAIKNNNSTNTTKSVVAQSKQRFRSNATVTTLPPYIEHQVNAQKHSNNKTTYNRVVPLRFSKDSLVLSKDFGFIENPAFVEALVQMTLGEYQNALSIFDSLKELPEISITERIRIVSKIAACYKAMGNFEQTAQNLLKKYTESQNELEKGNLLWEIINVKANCLQDYQGAEKDILTYIAFYPNGPWFEAAYEKLGEIQYITGKYAKAIGTYQYHISLFKKGKFIQRSLYTIANITRLDIHDFGVAIKWYTQLIRQYQESPYYSNALIERADCYEKTNDIPSAIKDYQTYLQRFPSGCLRQLCEAKIEVLHPAQSPKN